MTVPPKDNPKWAGIIKEQQEIQFEFLATKILLGRLNLKSRQDPLLLDECIDELREFFIKNSSQPKVVSDLKKIFE